MSPLNLEFSNCIVLMHEVLITQSLKRQVKQISSALDKKEYEIVVPGSTDTYFSVSLSKNCMDVGVRDFDQW